jgi:hypothetical protein
LLVDGKSANRSIISKRLVLNPSTDNFQPSTQNYQLC